MEQKKRDEAQAAVSSKEPVTLSVAGRVRNTVRGARALHLGA